MATYVNGIMQIEHFREDCIPEDKMDTATGVICSNCGARVDVISEEYVRGFTWGDTDRRCGFAPIKPIAFSINPEYAKGYEEGYNDSPKFY